MEDVSLLTLVIVNQDGEVLIALVVSKDYKNVIRYMLLLKKALNKAVALELGCFKWKN